MFIVLKLDHPLTWVSAHNTQADAETAAKEAADADRGDDSPLVVVVQALFTA